MELIKKMNISKTALAILLTALWFGITAFGSFGMRLGVESENYFIFFVSSALLSIQYWGSAWIFSKSCASEVLK